MEGGRGVVGGGWEIDVWSGEGGTEGGREAGRVVGGGGGLMEGRRGEGGLWIMEGKREAHSGDRERGTLPPCFPPA